MKKTDRIDIRVRDPDDIKMFRGKSKGTTFGDVIHRLRKDAMDNVELKFLEIGKSTSNTYGNPELENLANAFHMFFRFDAIKNSEENTKEVIEDLHLLFKEKAKKWGPKFEL